MLLAKRIRILPCFLCFFYPGVAQFIQSNDAISLALSDADIGYTAGLLISNPACHAKNEHTAVGINYFNRYCLPELGTSSLSGKFCTGSGTLFGALHYFGTSYCNEIRVSLAYGRSLSSWMDAGISFNYHQYTIKPIDQYSGIITGEIGLSVALTEGLNFGFHLINPTGSAYIEGGIDLESRLRLGLTYLEDDNFYLCIQGSLMDYQKWVLSLGFEYYLVKQLVFRAGLQIDSDLSYSFGIGTRSHPITLSLGFEEHMVLGSSAGVMISYRIK